MKASAPAARFRLPLVALPGFGPSQQRKWTVDDRPVPVSSQRWPPTSKTSTARERASEPAASTELAAPPSSSSSSVRV